MKLIEAKSEINALNTQKKITSYNGHGNFCNCVKCRVKSEKQEIKQSIITQNAIQSDKVLELKKDAQYLQQSR